MNRRELLLKGGLAYSLLGALPMAITGARAQAKPLQIGVLPNVSARIIATQYEPLQSYLTQKLDRNVSVSTATDWAAFYRNTKAEQYDVVVAAVHVARLMQIDLGLMPIASYTPNIKGLFIMAKTATDTSVQALKGSKLVLANPASLLAFEGEYWLEKQGLKAGADYSIMSVRGDDSVGLTLIRGDACGGMLSVGEFNQHPPSVKEQLKIIQNYTEVPSFVVLAHPRIVNPLKADLVKQLSEFSDCAEGKAFEGKTNFKIRSQVNDKELAAMDLYLEKTRRLMV
jgi:phosphonate transport system substrate-binding protein